MKYRQIERKSERKEKNGGRKYRNEEGNKSENMIKASCS